MAALTLMAQQRGARTSWAHHKLQAPAARLGFFADSGVDG